MGAMTKLQAVNRMLRAASEYPVNSLSLDGVNDSNIAEAVLDETNLQEQLEGLNCNTVSTTINPTVDGFLYVPDDTLSVDSANEDWTKNVVVRGNRLFNVDENTFVFAAALQVAITIGLTFEDLPTAQQFRIVDQAARVYQMLTVGDKNADNLLAAIAQYSRAHARADDMASQDANLFNSASLNARAAVSRNFGFWQGSSWPNARFQS